jgi:uncharacterized protein with ATP-grasp and redox domains
MEIHPECIVCLFKLGLRAARAATNDEKLQREVLARLAAEIPAVPAGSISPEIGQRVQRIVREVTGETDPFLREKRRSNEFALAHLPELRRRVESADDALLEAIRLAVAGNVIDLAVGSGYDLEGAIAESLEVPFAIFDYEPFTLALERARRLLYLADNAGEIVFDRLLVEELVRRGKAVTCAVRGGPAINDATAEDARRAGLHEIAEVIDTGTDLPSVLLAAVDDRFRERYLGADLVISKGQGNYEGLSEEPGPLACLLKAKCAPVARDLGVERGALVLRFRDAPRAEGRP